MKVVNFQSCQVFLFVSYFFLKKITCVYVTFINLYTWRKLVMASRNIIVVLQIYYVVLVLLFKNVLTFKSPCWLPLDGTLIRHMQAPSIEADTLFIYLVRMERWVSFARKESHTNQCSNLGPLNLSVPVSYQHPTSPYITHIKYRIW